MKAFWIGVVVALIAEMSDWLYAVFTFESFWTRVRVFLYWLPPNIALAFAAGFFAELLQAQQNEAGLGLVAAFCFLATLAIAYVLERNGFILRREWKDWSADLLRFKGKLLYTLAITIALIPYAWYFRNRITVMWMVGTLILVLATEWILHNWIWNFLHASEGALVKDRLQRLIRALCQRCVAECPFFVEESPNVLEIVTHSRTELEGSLSATQDLLAQILRFSPLDAGGRPLPGLSEEVLPPKRIKEIAREVQAELLRRLDLRRRIVHILIGDQAELAEALSLVAKEVDLTIIAQLEKRRRELGSAL